jgi:hypothetical protein
MADKKKSAYQPSRAELTEGNNKSSGKGGGKSAPGGPEPDIVGNAKLRGEDPSPDNRRRGETSRAD